MIRIAILLLAVNCAALTAADELRFVEQELPTKLGVGYAVRVLDMNGDEKLDIAIVDSKRVLWLENPTWKERLITNDKQTKSDNVCFAPHDIDGDGLVDFAIGADWQFGNTRSGATLQWATRSEAEQGAWKVFPLPADPTLHRINFADVIGDERPELILAPLKGRNTDGPKFAANGIRLVALSIPQDPTNEPWPETLITDQLHVAHNFCATDMNGDGRDDLLVASFEGVTLLEREGDAWKSTRIGAGEQERPYPERGASEVKRGKLADGGDYIATIEPWHGDRVVVYTKPQDAPLRSLWKRHVLDAELKWGHAVWCANMDDDADEELVIGVRDDAGDNTRRGLRIYDPISAEHGEWRRYVVDPGGVAIEDLTVGDLDGDGRNDVVAVGRQTQNVRIYWNKSQSDQ
ncbi:VCBS repeat-containing protein [Blastopirellula sp. J2-11]|uniref:VCBS repeat-containing protein n=1 Tax=Blastopirellula sp. J2-11 TaxID=2943192 RepID=UPI0021C5EB38|nr:VCBS repeat-containing protein [Blastopirellula sp. J2-11]UUO08021.1 VCBS repeat-containing protein [Blastopirellula sp. J2-11]